MRKLFFIFLLSLPFPGFAQAREFDIKEKSMYLPARQKNGKFDHSIALVQVYLPQAWLEQSVTAPMIEYKANYALPSGFTLNGNFKTLFIANDIRLGFSWNYPLAERLHLGLYYQLGLELGVLHAFNYNNTMRVWEHHPMLRLGYNFRNVAFSLQGKLDWMIGTKLVLEDYATNNITGSSFNGYSLGLWIEQRLTRKNSISFGFMANFNKFHILGWPALMIADERYFIPEIIVGFRL